MSRKRMILEEVEEKNLLVSGTPANPLTLGEKAKSCLVHLSVYERDGRHGDPSYHYGDSSYSQAMERLEYLKLIEYLPQYDTATLNKFVSALDDIRAQLSIDLQNSCSSSVIHKAYNAIAVLETKIQSNPVVAWLTDAGRGLLLSGTVSVSL